MSAVHVAADAKVWPGELKRIKVETFSLELGEAGRYLIAGEAWFGGAELELELLPGADVRVKFVQDKQGRRMVIAPSPTE